MPHAETFMNRTCHEGCPQVSLNADLGQAVVFLASSLELWRVGYFLFAQQVRPCCGKPDKFQDLFRMNTYLPVALTLAGCSIGAGLVALPAAFDQARPPVAAVLLGGTALLNIFSLWYVAAAAKLSGASNYGEMALCFGHRARLAMVRLPCLTQFQNPHTALRHRRP
jgi:hypothetical protein